MGIEDCLYDEMKKVSNKCSWKFFYWKIKLAFLFDVFVVFIGRFSFFDDFVLRVVNLLFFIVGNVTPLNDVINFRIVTTFVVIIVVVVVVSVAVRVVVVVILKSSKMLLLKSQNTIWLF